MTKKSSVELAIQPQRMLVAHQSQQGAALIVVLLILILIMLVGTMAVRQSTTNLKVATSDQINTLLLQSADGANIQLEQMVNGGPNTTAYQTALIEKNGIFSYFLDNPQNSGDELVYCYNPRSLQTLTNKTTIFRGTGTVFDNGRCDPAKADNYISGRQTSMTQVSIRRVAPDSSNSSDGFDKAITGNDVNNTTSTSNTNRQSITSFDIRSLSAIPAYSDVGSCYSTSYHGINTEKNVLNTTKCLRDASVPSKELYQRLELIYQKNDIECVSLSKGSGMSATCSSFF